MRFFKLYCGFIEAPLETKYKSLFPHYLASTLSSRTRLGDQTVFSQRSRLLQLGSLYYIPTVVKYFAQILCIHSYCEVGVADVLGVRGCGDFLQCFRY